jgi:hypothetical protein
LDNPRLVFSQSSHLLGPIPVILIQIPIKYSSDQSRMDFSVGSGVNNKIKVIKRKAYGFHDPRYFALKVK